MLLMGFSYPLLAHVAVLSGRPGLIAASIGWLVVLVLLPGLQRLRPVPWIVLATVSIGLYSIAGSSAAVLLLFLPPVLIDGFMAWVFGHTLRRGRIPLIESIVRALHGPQDDLTDDILRYVRRLTGVWTALFVVLAVVNAALALCVEPGGLLLTVGVQPPVTVPLSLWSLLANVLDYLLVGALFVIEFAFRRRRFPQQPYRGLIDFTRRVASLGSMFRGAGTASQPDSTPARARPATDGQPR
jgi:uncharacterized membrane protein